MSPPRNYGASVLDRLRNLAASRGRDVGRLLNRYVAERFLYRLGASPQTDRFTLKGAALLELWAGRELRSTKDVDFLAHGATTEGLVHTAIGSICAIPCDEDGVTFDTASMVVTGIREREVDLGARARLRAALGTARVAFQIDVGFGDALPARTLASYPTLLGHPAPRLWVYPREAAVAEKFEAMVKLGEINTRLKDFCDVALLAHEFEFEGVALRNAIASTFERRRTRLRSEPPVALTPEFYRDPARTLQWSHFATRAQLRSDSIPSFTEVGALVIAFLDPVRASLAGAAPIPRHWPAAGPWEYERSKRGG